MAHPGWAERKVKSQGSLESRTERPGFSHVTLFGLLGFPSGKGDPYFFGVLHGLNGCFKIDCIRIVIPFFQ